MTILTTSTQYYTQTNLDNRDRHEPSQRRSVTICPFCPCLLCSAIPLLWVFNSSLFSSNIVIADILSVVGSDRVWRWPTPARPTSSANSSSTWHRRDASCLARKKCALEGRGGESVWRADVKRGPSLGTVSPIDTNSYVLSQISVNWSHLLAIVWLMSYSIFSMHWYLIALYEKYLDFSHTL